MNSKPDDAIRTLSKSKLIAFRQCPKRLWLEIHRPTLRHDSAATQASFDVGNQVGEIARRLYDPLNQGALINPQLEGYGPAFERSKALLSTAQPIFEAGFAAEGALAFADVMLPATDSGQRTWRMVEVKSSTSVKEYHKDDAAIQSFVARSAGVPLSSIALAHIDSKWVYPGDRNYQGLLVESDLTAEVFPRSSEVKEWIASAQQTVAMTSEPGIRTSRHCTAPFECGFLEYCRSQEPQAEFPVEWLPRVQSKALKALIECEGKSDLRDIPDDLLNDRQRRVKQCTLSGDVYFDSVNAAADLANYQPPAFFLDFETIQFVVPIWKGTRPYQQIPFQYSLHHLSQSGDLHHLSFLDLTGNDPSKAFAESLIRDCGTEGPVFVYNAGFETARIRELGERFPELKQSLLAINERVFDLLKVAEQRYYHPSQHGSWSIKKVLPAIAPDLRYDALDGVQDGGMAMRAYLEAISPDTPEDRKVEIEKQLLSYCGLDTFAMVRLWQFFSGSQVVAGQCQSGS
jgi:hypothetical protein